MFGRYFGRDFIPKTKNHYTIRGRLVGRQFPGIWTFPGKLVAKRFFEQLGNWVRLSVKYPTFTLTLSELFYFFSLSRELTFPMGGVGKVINPGIGFLPNDPLEFFLL